MNKTNSRDYISPFCHILVGKFESGICVQSPTSETFNMNDSETDYSNEGITW